MKKRFRHGPTQTCTEYEKKKKIPSVNVRVCPVMPGLKSVNLFS